jgi:phosphate transport system substrate-binding protein
MPFRTYLFLSLDLKPESGRVRTADFRRSRVGTCIILMSLFVCSFTNGKRNSAVVLPKKITPDEETISISGAFALYPLAVKWGEEFRKIHPRVRFDISAGGAGKGISDALAGLVDLGAVSRDIYPEETKKGAFSLAVTKDAVIPIVNAANPNIKEILGKGLKRDAFSNIYIKKFFNNWKQAGYPVSAPIHVYTRSDASGAGETWARYFGMKQEDLNGIGVYGDPGLLQAVQKDVVAIGYSNMAYAYDSKTKKQLAGIRIIPIDINGNGKIDTDENFYSTKDLLVEAIASGKYPSPPARDLYFVCRNKPQKRIVTEFLKWVLTDGQKFVEQAGYIGFPQEKLDSERKKL